jgi:preprotein translocase subunit SecF
MQLIKPDINIDFVGKRKIALFVSIALILIGFASLVIKGGPNYGIDFAGGTLVQVRFAQPTDASAIKKAMKGIDLGSVVVQRFGDNQNEFLIRVEQSTAELQGLSVQIKNALEETYEKGDVDIRRVEMVGPQVGKDLRSKGLKAIFYAMLGLLAYISWRFEFRFAVGAIVALIHDVAITLGAFSLFNKEIDLPIIAAFLAIIGYSLNDTIIVYDRIRENIKIHKGKPLKEVINLSVNQSLSRTIITSLTTFVVVLILAIFGGRVLFGFSIAMVVGVIVGTYSSMFVAAPVLIAWEHRFKEKEKKGKKK